MIRICLILLILTLLDDASIAQDKFPDTDIYLLNIRANKDGFTWSDAINITDRPGYDNQPEFLPDGSGILYSSIRDDGQADIYEYIIYTKATARLTKTFVSEFSPQIIPGSKAYSAVVVEKDSTQRLWKYNYGIKDSAAQVILPKVDSVGYYCWANKNTLAIFKLTEPPILEIADVKTGHVDIVAKNIGRCIQRIPEKNAISYIEKDSVNGWKIMELNLKNNGISTIVNTLVGSEDYVWTSDGVLLMGKANKLYRYEPDVDTEWEQIADFTSLGIKDFYRLAISKDGGMLAIVTYKNKKP